MIWNYSVCESLVTISEFGQKREKIEIIIRALEQLRKTCVSWHRRVKSILNLELDSAGFFDQMLPFSVSPFVVVVQV